VNTGFYDGAYSVPAGHVERGESATVALAREAYEELGVTVLVRDLVPALVMHRRDKEAERVDFFFSATVWGGDIVNAEPDKCDELVWFPLTELPQVMVPYVRTAIDLHLGGSRYAEFGWDE
jgi:ADP-ribose pyrophosphatase YjhB (NUDIX family)